MIKGIQLITGNEIALEHTYVLTDEHYADFIASLSTFDLEVLSAYLTVLKRAVKLEKQKRRGKGDSR